MNLASCLDLCTPWNKDTEVHETSLRLLKRDIFRSEQITINLQYTCNKTLFYKCNSCAYVLLMYFEMVNT